MLGSPRIVPPGCTQNLAGSFLPRGFTVNRADGPVRRAKSGRSMKKGQPARGCPLKTDCERLLVVLPVEEARNVDGIAPEAGLGALLFVDLRLLRAAGAV